MQEINKLLQRINYGMLSFSSFEKINDRGTFINHALQKKTYDRETREFKDAGSFNLDYLFDLSIIKKMLLNIIPSKRDNITYLPYSIEKYKNNNFIFKKEYEKNNEVHFQSLELTVRELYAMVDLIDRVIAITIKPLSIKERSNKGEFIDIEQEITNNSISEEYMINDDIPF